MRELRGAEAAYALNKAALRHTEALAERGITPCLGIVRIGCDAAGAAYERGLMKRFAAAGADVKRVLLDGACTQAEAEKAIKALAECDTVHGILLFLPVPKHLDADRLRLLIPAKKDVDGASPLSAGLLTGGGDCFVPCTAEAVVRLMEHYEIDPCGKSVCIVGRSAVVGKPLGLLLLNKNATVTVCHTATRSLAAHTVSADIIIASAGSPAMISADMVAERSILIDVGINTVDGRLCGDASTEACQKAAAYTPVPGGVGALTTAVLLMHTVQAAMRAQKE